MANFVTELPEKLDGFSGPSPDGRRSSGNFKGGAGEKKKRSAAHYYRIGFSIVFFPAKSVAITFLFSGLAPGNAHSHFGLIRFPGLLQSRFLQLPRKMPSSPDSPETAGTAEDVHLIYRREPSDS